MTYRNLVVGFVICYATGIFLVVAFTDTSIWLENDDQDSIERITGKGGSLPTGLRVALASALLARNRSTGALDMIETPDIAPIIGGTDAVEFKYPWYALVMYIWNDGDVGYFCGGTIYNEKTIITSADCVYYDVDQVDGYFAVVVGEHDKTVTEGLEQTVLVDDVRLHPGFRTSGAFVLHDDIALLITDTPIDFSTSAVKPVPSLSTERKDRMALRANNCVAIGFGIYKETPEERLYPDILQEYSPVNLVSNKECHRNLWRIEYSVTSRMVCSIDENTGICSRDGGGPIGCYDDDGVFYQVGISSWSPRPNRICGEYASVYTRISKYLRWINYYSYRL